MRSSPAQFLTFVVSFALASSAFAADGKAIDSAIHRGVERLFADQDSETGSWTYDEKDKKDARALGMTSLAALALYENGVLPTDPKLRKALRYIREKVSANEDTYSVSLATIVLARVGNRDDRSLVKECARRLVACQAQTGGWDYTCPRETRDKGLRKSENSLGDYSVTQFVVLALWQAQRVGFNIDEPMRRLRMRLSWSQVENGGWNYKGLPDMGGDSHTMTTAAVYMWLVASATEIKKARAKNIDQIVPRTDDKIFGILQTAAEKHKEESGKTGGGAAPKKGNAAGETDYKYPPTSPPTLEANKPSPLLADQFLEKAIKRTGEWADSTCANAGAGYYFYYIWSVQRLGVLLGVDKLGKTDWYAVGADAIVKSQHKDGSFGAVKDAAASHYKYGPDTAFALLFLRKANLGSDVAKLLNPDPGKPFAIAGTDRKFATLAEAVKEAKPKDIVSIGGDGPFELASIVVDKPVALRAVAGYEPVFRYQPPKDKFGGDLDPNKFPDSRHLFILKGGAAFTDNKKSIPVQFEGCRFQMDPPRGVEAEYSMFRSDGVSVQFLNCAFTSKEKRAACFELHDAPRLFIRNSLLVGFAPAAKIESNLSKLPKGTALGVRDSVFFTPSFVQAKGDGGIRCFLVESSIQCTDGFDLGELAGPFASSTENNVFQAKQLFAALGKGDREWGGLKNLYDLETWVGKGPSKATRIQTIADWKKYWQETDNEKRSVQGVAPFVVYRPQVASFRHELSSRDWALKDEEVRSVISLKPDDQLGANIYFVGPGDGYLQFREAADYSDWTKLNPPSERGGG